MAQLSDAQLVVLSAACQRPDRCVFPVSAKLKGNAAGNVLKSLLKKKLIKEARAKRDDTVWRHDKKHGRMTLQATRAAYEALGIDPREVPPERETDGDTESTNETDAATKASTKAKTRTKHAGSTRTNSKQAKLIEMLHRSEGASIKEIVKAFDWQPHTVRGAIAGALKKKLGLNVVSEKVEGRGRVYRVTA